VTSIKPTVLAFSGPIGSGKTTTAAALARQLGWPHAGYGDIIRAVTAARGLPPDRGTLQQIGQELAAAGWDSLTRQLLQLARWAPGTPLIVDGLRHTGAATALRHAVAPLPVVIVYLELPPETASARTHRRDHITGRAYSTYAGHTIETGLPAVRQAADLVIDVGDSEPDQIAGQIITHAVCAGTTPGRRCA
jgi:shikimate kinase